MPKAARAAVQMSDEPLSSEATLALLDSLATLAPPSPLEAGSLQAARQPGTTPPSERPDQTPPEEDEPDELEEEPADEPEQAPGEEDEEDIPANAPADPPGASADASARVSEYTKNFLAMDEPADMVFDGEITPPPKASPDAQRYASRIEILEAWQYPGSLTHAPAWIDRNWAAYSNDLDPLRNLAPGPCLKVPLYSDPATRVVARVGDYVALQSVSLGNSLTDTRIEVWAQENFQKLFMPRAS